jgi:16S rRNA (guanine1516-N2)-methyltransferase
LLDSIAVLDEQALAEARRLSRQLSLPVKTADDSLAQLRLGGSLSLNIPGLGKPFEIDFASGKYAHRRRFGGGRGQPMARAIGLKQGQSPSIIDATAGFGRDAFVLASLGCEVTMLEQNPVMSLLLADALKRAQATAEIAEIAERMRLEQTDAVDYLQQTTATADVIYLDPMYPSREKSALVKKDMQLLHQLVGADTNSAALLAVARQKALKRVVVKRPKGAGYVGEQKPAASIESKNTRYDLYPTI